MQTLTVKCDLVPHALWVKLAHEIERWLSEKGWAMEVARTHTGQQGYLVFGFIESKNPQLSGTITIACKGFPFSMGIDPPGWKFSEQEILDPLLNGRMEKILQWVIDKHENYKSVKLTLQAYSRCLEEEVTFPLSRDKTATIPVSEIILIKADGDLSMITYGHQGHHSHVLVDKSISECQEDLTRYGFVRVHRSYLINPGCVKPIVQNGVHVELSLCNGSVVPVARRRRSQVLSVISGISSHMTVHG